MKSNIFKWDWGKGLALVYLTAVFFLFLAVYKSFSIDRTLVVDNYYEEDLKYQTRFDKMSNTKTLGSDLKIVLSDEHNSLNIVMPAYLENVNGIIKFYKPNDVSQDFQRNINNFISDSSNDNLKNLEKGKWKVILDFSASSKEYYLEEDIYL